MVERFEGRGRHLEINIPKIAIFATKYFHDYPNARWNGRQIRNACQTALAIAEYEAQGSKHDAIMKPDAVITLNETHFETVAVAYRQFIEYVHKIWSTYADEKASEDKIRAPVTKGPPNPLESSDEGSSWRPKEQEQEFHHRQGQSSGQAYPALSNFSTQNPGMSRPVQTAYPPHPPSQHPAETSYPAPNYGQDPATHGHAGVNQGWSPSGMDPYQGNQQTQMYPGQYGNMQPPGPGYAGHGNQQGQTQSNFSHRNANPALDPSVPPPSNWPSQ
jgi:hypothetical protein